MKQNLLTGIIIILSVILIMLVGSIIYEEKINIDKHQTKDAIVNDNTKENNEKDELQKNEENDSNKEEYIGEEEQIEEIVDEKVDEKQDVNQDVSMPKSDEEIAIELAKNKWGEDKTVTFSIEEKKNNIYYVAVKSDATVIAWYEIDVSAKTVSEFY